MCMNESFVMSKIYLFLCLITFFSSKSFAEDYCYAPDSPIVAYFDEIKVMRDVPIGSVISFADAAAHFKCDDYSYNFNNDYGFLKLTYNGAKPSGMPNVFLTNLEGVGISVTVGAFSDEDWITGTERRFDDFFEHDGRPILEYNFHVTVKLIKIGEITPGNLSLGEIVSIRGSAGGNSPGIILTRGSVTNIGCRVVTPSLSFPIGDILASSFGNSVGTIPAGAERTLNLGLDCDPNIYVEMQFTGTQNPDISDNSILALNNHGSPGTASGVGVQLLYNGEPLPLNGYIEADTIGGMETFPLTARYYQTKPVVTTGNASASATMTITYQ